MISALKYAELIAKDVASCTGRALIVGGWTRDRLIPGSESKDIDMECYSIPAESIEMIAKEYGTVSAVGARFGVLKLRTREGYEIDLSIPRRENREGKGHKGFMVEADPTMSYEEAASRRDFTINSMAYDPLYDKYIDPFGGENDLIHRRLRATSDKFVEDPIRVLRGMQFAGRFALTTPAGSRTILLCNEMLHEYYDLQPKLPDGPVWKEWFKWASMSQRPSFGMRFLAQTDWIYNIYPMLGALINCPQDFRWHPEGDAWEHTMLVLDEAAALAIKYGYPAERRAILVFAALLHDIGKPRVTEYRTDGSITSHGHDELSAMMADEFLTWIGAPPDYRRPICELIREHMAIAAKPENITPRSVRRLSARMPNATIGELIDLITADSWGRTPYTREIPASIRVLQDTANECQVVNEKPKPILTGKFLLAAGWSNLPQNRKTGEFIRAAYEAQLDGEIENEDQALRWALDNCRIIGFPEPSLG